jgi:hypothetical protein
MDSGRKVRSSLIPDLLLRPHLESVVARDKVAGESSLLESAIILLVIPAVCLNKGTERWRRWVSREEDCDLSWLGNEESRAGVKLGFFAWVL